MSTRRKKHIIKTENGKKGRQTLLICSLAAAGKSGLLLLCGILLLAVWYWKKQPSMFIVQILGFLCAAAAFFLCGFFACRKTPFPPAKAGLLASLFLLLPLLCAVLLAGGGQVSLWVLVHLVFALALPIAGGLLGKKAGG